MNNVWVRLADGVYQTRLPFLDVTVGLVWGSGGVLLIDSGTTLIEAGGIDADVRGITGRTVSQVVLTHHHFDHILGSSVFGAAVRYAAPEVAQAITTRTDWLRADAVRHGADPGQVDDAIAALRAPDRLVGDTVIDLGDRRVRVHHPGSGHTRHDLIVVVDPIGEADQASDQNVVFCGDLVEESGDPAAGPDSDLECWPATLDRLLALGGENAHYVPGHGAAVDADFIRAQRDWLAARVGQ